MDLAAQLRRLHEAAQSAGLPSYRDPLSGLQVLTARFLVEQGNCCRRGCRHCPYERDSGPSGASADQRHSA